MLPKDVGIQVMQYPCQVTHVLISATRETSAKLEAHAKLHKGTCQVPGWHGASACQQKGVVDRVIYAVSGGFRVGGSGAGAERVGGWWVSAGGGGRGGTWLGVVSWLARALGFRVPWFVLCNTDLKTATIEN
jgi:hypothetical protein